MTFDAWEVGVHPSEDYLMHWGIPGMKHGRRRYQNEDGTWTEAGLEARRRREGFGERRQARKVAKYESRIERARKKMNTAKSKWGQIDASRKVSLNVYKRNKALGLVSKDDDRFIRKQNKLDNRELRAERKEDRKIARAEAMRQFREKRQSKNVKNLSDAELKKRIERLKLEQEYKDLNRSPALKTGMELVQKYMEHTSKKRDLAFQKYKMETERIRAASDYKKNAAANRESKANLIDAIVGTNRKKARAEFLKAKDQRSKNTIRGAISRSIGNIVNKEGTRFVKEMGDQSVLMKGGRKVKAGVKKIKAQNEKMINDMKERMLKEKKKRGRNNPMFDGWDSRFD